MSRITFSLKRSIAMILIFALFVNPLSEACAIGDEKYKERSELESPRGKELKRQEARRFEDIAEGADQEAAAEANYTLGKDSYYFNEEDDGLREALEYFQKASDLGHQKALNSLNQLQEERRKSDLDLQFTEEKQPFINSKSTEECRYKITHTADKVYAEEEENAPLEIIEPLAQDELPEPSSGNERVEDAFLDPLDEISQKPHESLTKEEKRKLREIMGGLQKSKEISEQLHNVHQIIVLLGPTGAGKSTLARWFTGQEMPTENVKNEIKRFTFSDTSEIASGVTSKTKHPQIYPFNRDESYKGNLYVDCPGFHDTRGLLQEIQNLFYIQNIVKNREAKFLITISETMFESSANRSQEVSNVFKNFTGMFKDPESLSDNTSLAVTWHDKHFDVEGIKARLQELAKESDNRIVQNLMFSLARSDRIAFFSRPSKISTNYETCSQSQTDKETLLNILQGMPYLRLQEEHLTVSPRQPKFQLLFDLMFHILKDEMIGLVQHYPEHMHNFFEGRYKKFGEQVDRLVEEGSKYYTPLTLIKGLSEEIERNYGSDFMKRAQAHHKKILIGGIIGIGGAVGVTLALLAKASQSPTLSLKSLGSHIDEAGLGTISRKLSNKRKGKVDLSDVFASRSPQRIASPDNRLAGTTGVMVASGSSYWFHKYLWDGFLRNEFMHREGAKLKSELYKFVLDLHRLKETILNKHQAGPIHTFFSSSVPLSIARFSNIQSTSRLLNFISGLRGITPQELERSIWSDIFQDTVGELCYQFCQPLKEFYKPSKDSHKTNMKGQEFSYTDVMKYFSESILSQERIKKNFSHLPQDFFELLAEHYFKEASYVSNPFHLSQGSLLSSKKLTKLIHYMELCQAIYTEQATATFMPDHTPSKVQHIWTEIIGKKERLEKKLRGLEGLETKELEMLEAPFTYYTSKKTGRNEVLSVSIDEKKPEVEKRFKIWLEKMNHFLTSIGEPVLEEALNQENVISRIKIIQSKVDNDFKWHFNPRHTDKEGHPIYVRIGNKDYPLSHQSLVSISFLHKTSLLGKENIYVLDVGFRNLEKLQGIASVIKEKFLSFKDNPLTWFNELGEVDYIAYIQKSIKKNPLTDKLVIVYSGSNSLEDWKANISLGKTEFLDLAIHSGMGRLVGESQNTYFMTLIDKVKYHYNTHRIPENFKIVTTGHSLGGGLALLAAYYYKRNQMTTLSHILGISQDKISVKAFTFAAPAIVSKASQERIKTILGENNIWRVWNYQDPVVKWTEPLAYHVGRTLPLFNISNDEFGYLDKTMLGVWGKHGAERYLHHLKCLENPTQAEKDSFSFLEHIPNFYAFYTLGKEVGIFASA